MKRTKVILRDQREGRDSRYLEAYLGMDGSLHIDGHDLGPATSIVAPDGEYEWFRTIEAEHLPGFLQLLGGRPGDDILQVLEERWSGERSGDLERLLSETSIPITLFVR
jgi:hypothetical protein